MGMSGMEGKTLSIRYIGILIYRYIGSSIHRYIGSSIYRNFDNSIFRDIEIFRYVDTLNFEISFFSVRYPTLL